MTGQTFTVAVPDGRRVEVLTAGPEGGLPLIVHNGTPVGLVAYPPMVQAAAQRGLRLVMCARPGYGESTPRPGRRVADVTGDVAAVLDELGAAQFVTLGWSGGGPHALACAARLPGRCLAAASMAGVAPRDAEDLDWAAGMADENVAEFGAAMAGEEALTSFLEEGAADLATMTGPQVADGLGTLVSAADKAAATGEFAEYLAAAFRAAVRNGIAGWRDDDLAFATGWGFTMAEAGAGAPVAVWQGDQDMMVPWAHGVWLAAHVPGARAHLLPGEGHLTLGITSFGAILGDLLEAAGPGAAAVR
jgi:pimeloyl-ACP methyl ester carboxylesterase